MGDLSTRLEKREKIMPKKRHKVSEFDKFSLALEMYQTMHTEVIAKRFWYFS